MLQKSLSLLGLLLLLVVTAANAAPFRDEHARTSDSYLAIQPTYVDLDTDRFIDGQGLGATFLYGNGITRHWFIETRVTGLVLERGIAGETDFYQQDIGVDAVYRFGEANDWQPFVLAGVSAIRNDVDVDDLDEVNVGAHLGVGILSEPLGRMGLRLRADVRFVHDQYLDGLQDTRLGIGLEIPLGGRRMKAAAPAGYIASAANDPDGDGVPDFNDRCPSSLSFAKVDANGCMQPDQTLRMHEITFDDGTTILTSAARAELAAVVIALRGQPELDVQINGHTDSPGSAETNQQLSLQRAEAVATHLALQGVPTQRLNVRGYGETRPVDSNSTAEGRERNRRIELVLMKPENR